MRSILPHILLLSIFISVGTRAGAQRELCEGDSVELNARNYEGENIRWQQSFDNQNFTDIPGGTDSRIVVYPNQTTYYRLKVEYDDCEPQFSGSRQVVFPCGDQSTVQYSGRTYDIISVGCRCWFAENLSTENYANGDPVPELNSDNQWGNADQGAQVLYDFDPDNEEAYGRLYNWYAVADERNLCPEGWRPATDGDWTELESHLGGRSGAGGKLKETGNDHWRNPNTGATDEIGFGARPGGLRNYTGNFHFINHNGYWWSADAHSPSSAFYRGMVYYYGNVERQNADKQVGLSVRCVKE